MHYALQGYVVDIFDIAVTEENLSGLSEILNGIADIIDTFAFVGAGIEQIVLFEHLCGIYSGFLARINESNAVTEIILYCLCDYRVDWQISFA